MVHYASSNYNCHCGPIVALDCRVLQFYVILVFLSKDEAEERGVVKEMVNS